MRQVSLSYPLLKKPIVILLVAFLSVVIFQLFSFANPKSFISNISEHSFADSISFFLFNFLLIETITVFIVFRLILIYARLFRLNNLDLNIKSIVFYQVKFLPVFLISYFVFWPITGTIRFFYRRYVLEEIEHYFDSYLYSLSGYVEYLGPIVTIGYLVLNFNLIMEYIHDNKEVVPSEPEKSNNPSFIEMVVGEYNNMKKPLYVKNIMWFEVEERKYFAFDGTNKYRINKTISELEKVLDPNIFLKIKRDVLINIHFIEGYSPWFKGKHIVKMQDKQKTEFAITADRAHHLKEKMNEI